MADRPADPLIREFLGHADVKTTQIYMHYAPSERAGDDRRGISNP
jgi:integrase